MLEQLLSMPISSLIGGTAGLAFLLSICIEITPIKINPISKFLKWLGKKINGDTMEKLKQMEREIIEIKEANEQQIVVNCRYRILRFGDEILHGIYHSKDHFEQILLDIDTYEKYCDRHHDFKNNITQATTEIILEQYKECRAEGTFLEGRKAPWKSTEPGG